ncbi:hypothetical protein HNR23_003664 [Nocardiopsis mwathae]|uniref:DUF4178 domain-containing protein n=1 Tax=Nocardiopsis mwathae TaxID=1472723 RepID=A0A7W9YK08_9ACTN|nr:hypothetical protein [Nocardiopsis mwathae]
MTFLLLLAIAGLIALLVYLWRPNRPSAPGHHHPHPAPGHAYPPPPQPAHDAPRDPFADTTHTQGDPRTLKAGDMLDFGSDRTWIRGSLRLTEGRFTWSEHFLEVEQGKRWISVQEDPGLELALWTGRPDLQLAPDAPTIDVDGSTFRLTERGSASYRSEGSTGHPAHGAMDYADYEGPGGRLLAFERFDHGPWEVSTGESVVPGTFTIYPGG